MNVWSEESIITVIGLGRIGLPTALLFANAGFTVRGCETLAERRVAIENGICPIVEPGLQKILTAAIADGTFALSDAVDGDVVIICIGTTDDGEFTSDPIAEIIETIAKEKLVIIESTLPIGATARFADRAFAYCPERLAPGTLFPHVFEQTRLVGGLDSDVQQAVVELYQHVGFKNLEAVSPAEAEMCKLAENAFRDANIAFANQLAMTCYEHDVDVRRVIEVANTHPRVSIHDPGIGVGGACLAPASRALAEPNDFFEAVRAINESQVDRIVFYLTEVEEIAIFGLGYKPGSDDTRYSPAQALIEKLLEVDKRVTVWDPIVDIGAFRDVEEVGVVVIGCGHSEFAQLDPIDVANQTGANLVIDFTDTLDLDRWRKAGFSCIWR